MCKPSVFLWIGLIYLLSNIFEISKSVIPFQWLVKAFICLGVVVASCSLSNNIIKNVLLQVDLGEIPAFPIWVVGFIKLNVCLYQATLA